jgi:hypothetical protein
VKDCVMSMGAGSHGVEILGPNGISLQKVKVIVIGKVPEGNRRDHNKSG